MDAWAHPAAAYLGGCLCTISAFTFNPTVPAAAILVHTQIGPVFAVTPDDIDDDDDDDDDDDEGKNGKRSSLREARIEFCVMHVMRVAHCITCNLYKCTLQCMY